jgi:hypothetical protein
MSFGETHRFHLQGKRVSQARYQKLGGGKQSRLFIAGFLLGLLFDPEDGDVIFLRNVWLCLNYTAYNPEESTLNCKDILECM